jgi:hypothetical protein
MGGKIRVLFYGLGDVTEQYKAMLQALGCEVTVETSTDDAYGWVNKSDILVLGTPVGLRPDDVDSGPYLCGLVKEMAGGGKFVVGVGPGEWENMLADEVIPDPTHIDPVLLARLSRKLEALL